MKKSFVLLLSLVALSLLTFGQAADPAPEKEAITRAALDYIEGWFEGNAGRMDRALHPRLAKRMVVPNPQGGPERFIDLTKDQMVEATGKGGGKAVAPEKRAIKVTILDIYRDIASVRVDSVTYIDYLHLAKSEGGWKIVNVLWANNVKDR
jgi:hypothetical protein